MHCVSFDLDLENSIQVQVRFCSGENRRCRILAIEVECCLLIVVYTLGIGMALIPISENSQALMQTGRKAIHNQAAHSQILLPSNHVSTTAASSSFPSSICISTTTKSVFFPASRVPTRDSANKRKQTQQWHQKQHWQAVKQNAHSPYPSASIPLPNFESWQRTNSPAVYEAQSEHPYLESGVHRRLETLDRQMHGGIALGPTGLAMHVRWLDRRGLLEWTL